MVSKLGAKLILILLCFSSCNEKVDRLDNVYPWSIVRFEVNQHTPEQQIKMLKEPYEIPPNSLEQKGSRTQIWLTFYPNFIEVLIDDKAATKSTNMTDVNGLEGIKLSSDV